ncbi:hypothetical protein GLOIN_2v1849317 [Rhizophagus clarus]|uniref:Uncharacterized protein n=1 Tax=Rhizophagus clarus TaxID=94130 RepID=A0A8H3MHH3_9GLOM|nr:hypothetical protein GLOIN_2v1849317 [Rhizophagus clarus]
MSQNNDHKISMIEVLIPAYDKRHAALQSTSTDSSSQHNKDSLKRIKSLKEKAPSYIDVKNKPLKENQEGDGNFVYDVRYSKKLTIKEIDASAINLAKDLNILLKYFKYLPQNPPMCDKAGAQNVDRFYRTNENTTSVVVSKVSIKVQKKANYSINNFTNNFKNIATKLTENIFQFVNGEMNKQINKEIRSQGENTRTQAKTLVTRYFPYISSSNMSLMLQRVPRIYRLLLLTDKDWCLIDSFEELSSSFFKSAMKSASNFDIWINLVKTGNMVDYEEGSIMHEQSKNEMKLAKLNIIKSYFDGVGVSLNEFIKEDDE